MAREPDNLILTLLREIRDTLQDHSRLLNEHSEEFRRLNALFARPIPVMPGQRAGHPFRRPCNRDTGGMDCRGKLGNDGHTNSPES